MKFPIGSDGRSPAVDPGLLRAPLRLGILVLAVGLAWQEAAASDRFTPARCAALVQLFDSVVVGRFDHRLLGVEAHELDEARALRRQAERDCADGEIWFGVHAIEDALSRVHVVPADDRARRCLSSEAEPGSGAASGSGTSR